MSSQNYEAISSTNVFSPATVMVGSTLVVYFGGWYEPYSLHDHIYRAECHNYPIQKCDPAAMLIDPLLYGLDHLNDPTVIYCAETKEWLIYMTGIKPNGQTSDNQIWIAISTDLIHWSQPTLIILDIWQPSATVAPDGNIMVYGNLNYPDPNNNQQFTIIRYNMGTNGRSVGARTIINAPVAYFNPDVKYRPEKQQYVMAGENGGNRQEVNSGIDVLISTDGITFLLAAQNIVKPRPGQYHVRTPGLHPTDDFIVYYAETIDPNSMKNQIRVVQWSP
ncbi:unnamed protein product [Adineta steineri]|uniref:Glycosyl hydrolase family 32 N-terminal domain-containing protein n=1 Tax=Adineta steineri TaxID=433720 RepID=A0A814ZND4_9BILA|nr:unnamed protein product [Adineta steineri]CAF3959322.1 unnamed protein product [Adineta steineri]